MHRRLLIVLGLMGLLAACAPAGDGDGALPDPELVAVGAGLYQANCAVCHGSDLRGTDQGPSFLSVVYEPGHHGDGAFLIAVMAGVRQHHWDFGPMPPIPGLTAQDVEAIVAFVRDQQRIHGFEPYRP
jgi:mono/diheme cytochrome c family protein